MPGPAMLLPRMASPGPLILPTRWPSRLPRLRLSCVVLLRPEALRLRLGPPLLMLPPLRPPPRRPRLLLLPSLIPPLRLLPLVPLRPALALPLPLRLGGRVLLPPGGFPGAARTARAASLPLAGPSSKTRSLRPLSRPPTQGSPSMGVVLPPLVTPTAIPAARAFEGRPGRVLLLPPRGLPWSLVWWQLPGEPLSTNLSTI